MKIKIELTANETDYLEAAKKCSEANGGYFVPQDLCIYGYMPRGQSLNGTTGSLVNKGVISDPTEGWTFIEDQHDSDLARLREP